MSLLVQVDAAFAVLEGADEEAALQHFDTLDRSLELEHKIGSHTRLARLGLSLCSAARASTTKGAAVCASASEAR